MNKFDLPITNHDKWILNLNYSIPYNDYKIKNVGQFTHAHGICEKFYLYSQDWTAIHFFTRNEIEEGIRINIKNCGKNFELL